MRLLASAAACAVLGLHLFADDVAAAQNRARPAAKPAQPAPKTAPGPDLPSRLPPRAPVATVNGDPIPISEYVDRLSLRFGPEVRETLVEEQLIRQEARRRKISATAAEINELVSRTYSESVRRYGGEQRLADELGKSRGWTLADFKVVLRDQAEPQVLRSKLAEALVKPADIKDEEIAERYDETKERSFQQPDSVRISHILIRRPQDRNEAKDREARGKAEALLKKVQGGTPFEQAARESSEDRVTAEQGGKIPIDIARTANPFGSAFEAAVFPAPVGLVAEVIPSPDAYHIVRVDAKTPGRLLALAEVKEQLRASLLNERRQQAMEQLYVRLRTNAKVETGKF
jgi:foldase protein PrsA